jgi:hypothetical protein
MPSPKRHHYLPEFYLRGFCRDGRFWVFDREKTEFRLQTPTNTTVQTHFYSYRREDGSNDPRLESFFSEVETLAGPIIQRAEASETISSEDRLVLSVFAGLQQSRVPDHEKRQRELRRGIIEKLAGNVVPATDEELAAAPSVVPPEQAGPRVSAFELVKNLEALENDQSLAHNYFLRTIIPLATKISSVLLQMSWMIVHPPADSAFVTTDCPFQTLPPPGFDPNGLEGYGIGTPGALKIMPLSQMCCLLVLDEGRLSTHGLATRKQVRQINRALTATCDNFVIGRDEQQVRYLVQKAGIDKSQKGPRVVIQ